MEMIIYDSRANSGTTKHFAKQLGQLFQIPVLSVTDVTTYTPIKPYVLCTHTMGWGEVPENTQSFLAIHADKMIGVVANGSSNFRAMGYFARAGDKISAQYEVELLGRLDMGGTREDLHQIAARLEVLTGKTIRNSFIEQVRPHSEFINGRFILKPLS